MERRQTWLFPLMVVAAGTVTVFGCLGIAVILGFLPRARGCFGQSRDGESDLLRRAGAVERAAGGTSRSRGGADVQGAADRQAAQSGRKVTFAAVYGRQPRLNRYRLDSPERFRARLALSLMPDCLPCRASFFPAREIPAARSACSAAAPVRRRRLRHAQTSACTRQPGRLSARLPRRVRRWLCQRGRAAAQGRQALRPGPAVCRGVAGRAGRVPAAHSEAVKAVKE